MGRLAANSLAAWILCCGLSAAQPSSNTPDDAPEAGESSGGATVAPPIAEVRPRTYYIRDENGKLVPVFADLTFEDFERLYKLDQKLTQPDQPPRYSLQSFAATGTARANRAELQVQLRLIVHEDAWVRVPLQLDAAVLREPPRHQGDGAFFLDYEGRQDGYVAWLRGAAGKEHTLSLSVVVPLTKVGGETRLRLDAPQAASSELRLKVPAAPVIASVSDGARLLPAKKVGSQSELTVLGVGPQMQLSWHEGTSSSVETPTYLEAHGNILVRVDGPTTVLTEVELQVRSFGGPLEGFQVRLPAGAQLVSGNQAEYTVAAFDEQEGTSKNGGDGPQLVEIKLRQRTTQPVDVRLITETVKSDNADDSLIEVASFDVIGALRQAGEIAVVTSGNWLVQWTEGPHVRRLRGLAERPHQGTILAGFEYFRQPCSLNIRVEPKTTRVSVEPIYVLHVEKEQVLLDARLKYNVRGAEAEWLEVDLPGWEIEKIEPESLIQREGLMWSQVTPLVIPLAEASPGEFELRLRARRSITAQNPIRVPLPHPRVGTLLPATLVVLPADNVELLPHMDEISDLTPELLPPDLPLPERQQIPLCYRDRSGAAASQFVADLTAHSRSITVDVETIVDIQRGQLQATQTFSYRVRYEPVDRLTVEVPVPLARTEAFDAHLGDARLTATLPDVDAPGGGATPMTMQLRLPAAKIGSFDVVISYRLPVPQLVPDDRTQLTIPLMMPGEGRIVANRAAVTSAAPIGFEVLDEETWSPTEELLAGAVSAGSLLLSGDGPTDRLDLVAVLAEHPAPAAATIEKAWVQTWLTSSSRQDRAVFLVSTREPTIRLSLPAGAVRERVVVLLDGEQVKPRIDENGRLAIALNENAEPRAYRLEMAYPFSRRPAVGKLSIDVPRIEGDDWMRRFYWHLVTPGDEHLIATPPTLTSEQPWIRQGYYWTRRPGLQQKQLEQWIGATEQAAPPQGANQYLFSSFGKADPFQARTADRRGILLVASGIVLVAGLLLIYFPVVRHPAALLMSAMVLLVVGGFDPGLGLMAAQAACVGIVLVLIAKLLHWTFAQRQLSHAVIHGAAAGSSESASRVRLASLGDASSQTSTATAHAPIHVSAPPVKP